jgi:hypothetical protein
MCQGNTRKKALEIFENKWHPLVKFTQIPAEGICGGSFLCLPTGLECAPLERWNGLTFALSADGSEFFPFVKGERSTFFFANRQRF